VQRHRFIRTAGMDGIDRLPGPIGQSHPFRALYQNLCLETTTELRNLGIRQDSKSNLRTRLLVSPAGFAIAASLDPG
jgi:hypothetical protein